MTDNRTAMELHVLRRENAELRRLIVDMWARFTSPPFDGPSLRELRERMRRLRITEVDHEG